MNEALAQVTSRKCLTHSALDEESATGVLQPTTPSGCRARWFGGGTTRHWCGGLMPPTGRCSALTPDQPLDTVHYFFMHSSFLADLHCVCQLMVQHRWSWTEAVVRPEVERRRMSQRDTPFWTAHGSRYMLICFKDWLEVFFKASVLFIYLGNSHDESINYICTYCSKDDTTVYEMQVLCLWHYINKVGTAALFQYFRWLFVHHAKGL